MKKCGRRKKGRRKQAEGKNKGVKKGAEATVSTVVLFEPRFLVWFLRRVPAEGAEKVSKTKAFRNKMRELGDGRPFTQTVIGTTE